MSPSPRGLKGFTCPVGPPKPPQDLTPATGARTTRLRRPRSCRSSRALRIAHGSLRSALRSPQSAHDTFASTASHPNVRDDRDTPLVRDETASVISLIWGGREAEYFCAGDSTENSNTQVICPSGARVARRRARKDRAMGKRLGFARGPRVSVLVGRCL